MKANNTSMTVAKTAGFCFGVDRAVELVYKLVAQQEKVCTLGPIIHNAQVVEDLHKKGVTIIEAPDKAPKDACIVIRSHGVPRFVYQQIDALGLRYQDATCPFVAKIHKLVEEAGDKIVFVAGDPYHPEVIGICGHCQGETCVFETLKDLQIIFEKHPEWKNKEAIMVAQTTFHIELWEKCVNFAKYLCTNLQIFDTICYATCDRQIEAAQLAQNSDCMIVVGGRHSSNTAKLVKVCEQYAKTFLVEQANELRETDFNNCHTIGITAGASTPADIIKEVHTVMNKIIENQAEELSFAELFEQSEQQSEKLYSGKKIKGVVVSFSKGEVQVDIGGKQSGIIPFSEWSNDSDASPQENVQPGDEIETVVVRVSEQDGLVTLSRKMVEAQKCYDSVIAAMENNTVLSGKVREIVKGGALVKFATLRVFIPMSQLSDRRIEEPEKMLGQDVEFKVLEVNPKRKKVVGSVREVLKQQRKEKEEEIWKDLQVGQTFTGTVRSITSYGAFVDIGGIDGMIHITDLSWQKIKHPSEIVKVGDTISVYVKDLDEEKHRISLGYKKYEDNPWVKFEQDYQVGQIIQGKVISIAQFGAFVEIIPGIDGLIHISQLSNKRVEKVADAVSIGQEVEAKIISIDADAHRIGLSIRILMDEVKVQEEQEHVKAVEEIEGVEISQE